jgi:hypothetical protein
MTRSNKKRSRSQSKVPAGPSSKSPRKAPSSVEVTAGPSVEFSSQIPLDNSDEVTPDDPFTKIPRNFPLDDEEEAMADVSSVAVDAVREFPDDALSSLIGILPKKLRRWQDDGTDSAFDKKILSTVFVAIAGVKDDSDGFPESFLAYEEPYPNVGQFLNNVEVTKKSDPAFLKSLREAIKGHDKELWIRVLRHSTSPDLRWTGLSTAPFPIFRCIPRHDI